jgi:hypothetical protein
MFVYPFGTVMLERRELFALVQMVQPLGWRLKPYRNQPTFFASVLTAEDGGLHYFASLAFAEPVQLKSPRSVDDVSSSRFFECTSLIT